MPIEVNLEPADEILDAFEEFVNDEMAEVVGVAAVNHFNSHFHEQAFEGEPWPDVKRRDSTSKWYGFKHGSRVRVPDDHPRRKGTKGPYQPRKPNPVSNWSPAATRTPILSSQNSDLENSLEYYVQGNKVVVKSDTGHARIHNEGGRIKVFGKRDAVVPKRQFVGNGPNLVKAITEEVQRELNDKLGSK